jgi:hypothetical protein
MENEVLDYAGFIAGIREHGQHVPQADYSDQHLGKPVVAKFYRMPDGAVFGIKEWDGNEVVVPIAEVEQFNEFFPPQGTI